MDAFESDSESDCIDDTGCEEHMQDTYWDINYMQRIAADDVYEEEEEENNEEEKPEIRPIRRFAYKEENEDGEVVNEYYTEPLDEEESYDDVSSSGDSSIEEDETEMTEAEKKHLEKMKSMGVNVEKDELYDPKSDDKNEEWTKCNHYKGEKADATDAVLCCPSCFTTICYHCTLVKKGIFKSINRENEKKGSVVYKAATVFNTLVLFNEPLQGGLDNIKSKKAFLGYPVVCEVCGNEIGFKHGDDYYLMNMIEEDGVCFSFCYNKQSYRWRRFPPPFFFPFFFLFCDACSWMRFISRSVNLLFNTGSRVYLISLSIFSSSSFNSSSSSSSFFSSSFRSSSSGISFTMTSSSPSYSTVTVTSSAPNAFLEKSSFMCSSDDSILVWGKEHLLVDFFSKSDFISPISFSRFSKFLRLYHKPQTSQIRQCAPLRALSFRLTAFSLSSLPCAVVFGCENPRGSSCVSLPLFYLTVSPLRCTLHVSHFSSPSQHKDWNCQEKNRIWLSKTKQFTQLDIHRPRDPSNPEGWEVRMIVWQSGSPCRES